MCVPDFGAENKPAVKSREIRFEPMKRKSENELLTEIPELKIRH